MNYRPYALKVNVLRTLWLRAPARNFEEAPQVRRVQQFLSP